MAEMSLEQKRALAIARARLRAKQNRVEQPLSVAEPEEDAPWYEDVLGYANRLAQSTASGLSGGYMDEAAAALDAPFVAGYRTLAEGQPFDLGRAYEDRRDIYRGELKDFRQEYPASALTSEIGGAVVSPINKVAAPFKISQAAGLGGRALRSAGAGGTIGGIHGTGHAEGGLGERAIGGGTGVVIGAGAGAAFTPILEGIAAVGRAGLQRILDRSGSLTGAEKKVADAIAEVGDGNLEVGLQRVQEGLRSGGRDTTIGDVSGIGGQRLARAAANVPGPASKAADDFVAARVSSRGERLQEAADAVGPNRFHDVLDKLTASQNKASKPLYDEAFAPVSDKAGRVYAQWDERLQRFLDDPIVQQGMAKGIRTQQLEALADDVPFNFQEYAVKGFDDVGNLIIEGTPNLRAMDAAKRGLDDILEGYRDKLTGKLQLDDYGRAVDRVRRSLVKKLDDITTDQTGRSAYKEARAAYEGPAKIKDAAWMGRRFMKGDEEIGRKTFDRLSEPEQQAFLLGVRRELSGMISKDTQTAAGKFADKKADLWQRLRNVLPGDKFNALKQGMEKETGKMQFERFINPRGGSQTTPLKEDIAELSRVPNWMLETAQGVGRGGGVYSLVGLPLRAARDRLTRPSQRMAQDLGRMLLTRDPTQQAAILQRLGRRRTPAQIIPQLQNPTSALARALIGK